MSPAPGPDEPARNGEHPPAEGPGGRHGQVGTGEPGDVDWNLP